MRASIGMKITLIVISFLLITTSFFVIKTSSLLEATLTQMEEETNLAIVRAKLKEINAILLSEKERIEVLGAILLKEISNPQKGHDSPKENFSLNFEANKPLLSIEIYRVSSGRIHLLSRKLKIESLKPFNLGENYIDYLRTYSAFPFASVTQKNIEIINSSFPVGPPLFTMGVPLLQDELGNVSHIVVADISLDILQETFSEKSKRTLYLTNRKGVPLAHKDKSVALTRGKMDHYPIVERSIYDPSKVPYQIEFIDKETNEVFIGAYEKSAQFGVAVFSQIEKDRLLEPSSEVKTEAISVAGSMIAAALFLSFLFSISLTSPIEKLATLVRRVSKGNFDFKEVDRVKSNDEVGDLAKAFYQMTEGLKEKDKVKRLFSKFHGISIAEDLISKDIVVGGQNKEVTVLFGDIRDFTKFTESRTPEEVVVMVNEYFSMMVGIITRHGGVVDKFIGDAVMAVWGAVNGSPDDTKNAITAALDMRKALLTLNKIRQERGQPPIIIGIGIHCGRAIAGIIGSQERMEYTVIGNTVNITSRVEDATKTFGTDLLVSEVAYEKTKNLFVFEQPENNAKVRGKFRPLKLYKVRGIKHSDGTNEIISTSYSDYKAGPPYLVKKRIA